MDAMDTSSVVTEPPKIFSIIGDSNVQRNLVDYNCTGREDMRGAQLVPCTSIAIFEGALSKVRDETNVLIISCLSNFLRDSEPTSEASSRVTSTLEKFRSLLFPYCSTYPDLLVMIAPPQLSRSPTWYFDSFNLIMSLVKSVLMSSCSLENIHLLPSQPQQVIATFF
jgi:hypothetical protein